MCFGQHFCKTNVDDTSITIIVLSYVLWLLMMMIHEDFTCPIVYINNPYVVERYMLCIPLNSYSSVFVLTLKRSFLLYIIWAILWKWIVMFCVWLYNTLSLCVCLFVIVCMLHNIPKPNDSLKLKSSIRFSQNEFSIHYQIIKRYFIYILSVLSPTSETARTDNLMREL